ncbi:MAG: MFS transporter [Solibacillus sp.]
MSQQSIWTKNFIFFCSSHFLLGLNYYLLATILPLYVHAYMQGDAFEMSLMITIYILGSVIARLFSGYFVDRFGKRLIGYLGFSLFLLASICYLGTLEGLFLMLIIRWIHGVGFALASTAINTAVLLILPSHRQGEGIGYFSMFLTISMVLGPSLGLFLWRGQDINLVLTAVIIVSSLALFCMIKLKIPYSHNPQTTFSFKDVIEIKAIPLSLVSFCLYFSYSSLASFLAAYTSDLHIESVAGIFFTLFGGVVILSRPLIARALDCVSSHLLFYPSILFFVTGMVLLSQATTILTVLVSSIFMGASYGLLNPFLQNIIVKQVPLKRSGAATATFFLFSDLGYGTGSYILGLTASFTNYEMMYLLSATVSFCAILIYWIYYHRKETHHFEAHI